MHPGRFVNLERSNVLDNLLALLNRYDKNKANFRGAANDLYSSL